MPPVSPIRIIGNFMTEAIYPTFLHEDPRYFRKVNGSVKGRSVMGR